MSKVTFTHNSITKHRDLADAIKENLNVVVVGTVANLTEKVDHEMFDKHLPDGITPQMISELSKYHGDFNRSQYVAVTETAADIFNAHADVKIVEAKVGVFAHGDHCDMTVERSHAFLNNKAKEGEPTHTLRHLYVTESTTYKGSSFKTLKKAISEEYNDRYIK